VFLAGAPADRSRRLVDLIAAGIFSHFLPYTSFTVVSHLVAYLGNEPDRLECALLPARAALYSQTPLQPNGWGLGFIQGGEVLLQKRPRSEGTEVDFFNLARDLHANALIARGGLEEDARVSADNADPFRFRWWLFGSVGVSEGFGHVRERLLASVPDFLRRNIRGRSASEHIFHLFLAFLHDAGLLETLATDPAPVGRALRESIAFVDRLLAAAGAPALRMALVATNGRCLVARSNGCPVQYLPISGIMDCTVCRHRNAAHSDDDRRISHEALRAVVVEADSTAPLRPGWALVPARGGLLVGADHIPRLEERSP
jgi:predicted glutamine amidotransferase